MWKFRTNIKILQETSLTSLRKKIQEVKGTPLLLSCPKGSEIVEKYQGFPIRKWDKDGTTIYDTAYKVSE